ncbi:hypothetical protein [Pseudohongiella spirulinae]|uniref:Uncharacterized protein n=1 Tax=Pseudohongiella spirulinae TaxID=1249552 RepID=A0A0S2KA74_9GAMM|nr:hypothetical protein [Pseudohongiella spirulinae]ALO44879.1 hypothetical protein PS2015_185 [Pseudohongiella spirulinae]
MTEPNRFPILLSVAVILLAAGHLGFEHFTGGVRSHNLLNDPDLPAISNWLGLITLPAIAVILGLRVRTYPAPAPAPAPARLLGLPRPMLVALVGALFYGAAMATSFWLGAENITFGALVGLFVCALVFPVYRAEYILGFVVGMTATFGGVLPLIVALVVAVISFLSRLLFGKVFGLIGIRNKSDLA